MMTRLLSAARSFTCLALLAICGWPSIVNAAPAIDFARDIAPIFERHCIRCHQASNKQGDVSLATAADVLGRQYVTPGDADASYLLEVVTAAEGEKPLMPQEGAPLSAEEVESLRAWIAGGAAWPDDVIVKERSKADHTFWSFQPLAASEPAADSIPAAWRGNLVDRYVYMKLSAAGLQPSPPADRRALVRRLTYDLTGLPPSVDEVAAFEADTAPNAYELLVDRLLASPRYGEHWGRHWLDVVRFGESTGYEVNHLVDNAWPYRDYVIRSLNDDKPFDRFVIEHLAGDAVGPGDAEVEVGLTFLVCGPHDIVGNQDAMKAAQIRADTVDEIIRSAGETFLGLTVGCARCHDHKFDPITQRDYYGLYATFAGVFHDDRVVGSKTLRVGRYEQPPAEQCIFERGDANRKGEAVTPASMGALDAAARPYALPADAPERERRLAFARWLVSEDNPLTPRVLVNRLWQHHFGVGIVATPSDFGYMGERPSHPELLDWLAGLLRAGGWRLKPIHKLIVMSQAYRQASTYREEAAAVDAESRLLWRYPPRRLGAEEVRDTVLWLAGKLDERGGGPGFRLYEYSRDNVATYTPLDDFGPETFRRSVYHQNARAARVDLLSDFDAPDCAFSVSRRVPTTTPTQALSLMNHRFTLTMAAALAERLRKEAGEQDPAAQVERAYRLAFGRSPEESERDAAADLVARHGLRAFCRALLNSSELIYLD